MDPLIFASLVLLELIIVILLGAIVLHARAFLKGSAQFRWWQLGAPVAAIACVIIASVGIAEIDNMRWIPEGKTKEYALASIRVQTWLIAVSLNTLILLVGDGPNNGG